MVAPITEVGQTPSQRRAEPEPPFDLTPSVVQKTIRASFFKFKKCYEAGLARDPKLAGRVSVRFVIENDGTVSDARESREPSPFASPDGGTTTPAMEAPEVVACIVSAFRDVRFPTFTKSKHMIVVYPIAFSPGDP